MQDPYQILNNNLLNLRSEESVKNLLDQKANPNTTNGTEPVIHLAYKKLGIPRTAILKLLFEAKGDANTVNKEGKTLAHLAYNHDSSETLQLLFDYQANFNIQDKEGKTPLFIACERNKVDYVKLLIEKNADPNIKIENLTPLEKTLRDISLNRKKYAILECLFPCSQSISKELNVTSTDSKMLMSLLTQDSSLPLINKAYSIKDWTFLVETLFDSSKYLSIYSILTYPISNFEIFKLSNYPEFQDIHKNKTIYFINPKNSVHHNLITKIKDITTHATQTIKKLFSTNLDEDFLFYLRKQIINEKIMPIFFNFLEKEETKIDSLPKLYLFLKQETQKNIFVFYLFLNQKRKQSFIFKIPKPILFIIFSFAYANQAAHSPQKILQSIQLALPNSSQEIIRQLNQIDKEKDISFVSLLIKLHDYPLKNTPLGSLINKEFELGGVFLLESILGMIDRKVFLSFLMDALTNTPKNSLNVNAKQYVLQCGYYLKIRKHASNIYQEIIETKNQISLAKEKADQLNNIIRNLSQKNGFFDQVAFMLKHANVNNTDKLSLQKFNLLCQELQKNIKHSLQQIQTHSLQIFNSPDINIYKNKRNAISTACNIINGLESGFNEQYKTAQSLFEKYHKQKNETLAVEIENNIHNGEICKQILQTEVLPDSDIVSLFFFALKKRAHSNALLLAEQIEKSIHAKNEQSQQIISQLEKKYEELGKELNPTIFLHFIEIFQNTKKTVYEKLLLLKEKISSLKNAIVEVQWFQNYTQEKKSQIALSIFNPASFPLEQITPTDESLHMSVGDNTL